MKLIHWISDLLAYAKPYLIMGFFPAFLTVQIALSVYLFRDNPPLDSFLSQFNIQLVWGVLGLTIFYAVVLYTIEIIGLLGGNHDR